MMDLDMVIVYYLCGIMVVLGLITGVGLFLRRQNDKNNSGDCRQDNP